MRLADYLYAISLTLWVGALWAIGYVAAPILFRSIADHGLAGDIAEQQFAIVAWLGIGCSIYLLGYLFVRNGAAAFKQPSLWLTVLMLMLTLIGHFGVAPVVGSLRSEMARSVIEEVVRSRFQTWHGIASVLWLVQSVLGIALVTQNGKR